jgi:hypothetical protein
MKAPMTPEQVVERIKVKLISSILQSIDGLSVRQAESVTGMSYQSISRMRQGIRRGHLVHLLEYLIKAAIKAGVTVDVHIGEPHRNARIDGRQDLFRPKRQRRHGGKT